MAIVALLLPAVMDMSRRTGMAPSRLLMPMTFGALLGGMTTMFATLPNLLASTALRSAQLEPFGMLDFLPVGGAAAVAGIVFMTYVGRRLLPQRDLAKEAAGGRGMNLHEHYELHERMFVLRLPPGCALEGRTLEKSRLGPALGLHVVGVLRGGRTQLAPTRHTLLQAEDRLLIQGTPDQLKDLDAWRGLIVTERTDDWASWMGEDMVFAEARLSAESRFADCTLPWLEARQQVYQNHK
jgi:di/tricarboxylate transporter